MATNSTSNSSPSSVKLCTEKLIKNNSSVWRDEIRNALGYMNLDGYLKEHTPAKSGPLRYRANNH
ncbi:hypothetical protein VP01_661g5 [Puccinia sorghi]|uniref:Uncharacterized protein n=1 Tax=Puccinia sorghi TaxID=27349 RepID=A0A0L6UHA0_9BASI|nr:hypothetical protein VP01_661g5 [Puccinia sorghi]